MTTITKQGSREETGLGVILDHVAEKASWGVYIQLGLNKGVLNTGREICRYLANE